MKVKSESEVAQSCPTLSDPMDCSQPGSSVHGIFQARVLEWGAIVGLKQELFLCPVEGTTEDSTPYFPSAGKEAESQDNVPFILFHFLPLQLPSRPALRSALSFDVS